MAAQHNRADDAVTIDGATGKVLATDFAAQRPSSAVIVASMFEIHRGAFFGLPGRIVLFMTSISLPFFAISGVWFYLARRRMKRKGRARRVASVHPIATP